MNKIYQRIDWENYPSSATPLNEDNLNKMDYAIDKLDDRVVAHETTKLDTATGNSLVKDVTFDETTGIFTIEKLSGSKITINTALEKISTNFHFNPTTQKLILTLIDGTVQEIDLSALITQYEFLESDTITFEIDASGKVKANILNGSITGEKLEPNYLADVTLQANNAKTSADNAKTSEELAYQYAEDARQSASETQKNNASNISYDNATSGLTSDNVQGAIDEIKENLNKKADNNPYYMTSSTAGYGSGGYVAFARLEVKSSYQNSPIEFELICRGRKESCRVSIQFECSSANDPAINVLSYTGADYGVFAHKINTSIWELYYTKSEAYDLVTVTRISHVNGLAIEITHPGTYLSTKPTTTIVNASLGCAVASAETSTKAMQDGDGNVITSTYATKTETNNRLEILELLALAETRGWKEATVSSVKLLFGGSIGKYVAVIPTSDCADGEYYFLKTNNGAIYYGKMKETTVMNYPKLIHGIDVGIIGGEGVNNTIGQRTFNLDTQQGSANMGWGTSGAGGVGIVCSQNKELKAWYIRVSDATIADLKANKSSVLSTVSDCTASTTSTDIASASALAELKNSLTTRRGACVEATAYNTVINTTWTNNLFYKNQIIDCTLAIRLNAITANTEYDIFDIPSGYQPPDIIQKIYTTQLGTRVLVSFRPTNVIVIKPFSDITTNTEILHLHETWIQI